MAQKPSIPKGTRDFSPAEMMRRNYIFDTIRSVFRTYGFAPLETPAMENLSTLLGKYGDEGDKLLFRVLNSGDYAAGLSDEEVRQASRISEKGLRYDLTVPFARYVATKEEDNHFADRFHLADLIYVHVARGPHSLLSGIDISDKIAQPVVVIHCGRNEKRTVALQIRYRQRGGVFPELQRLARLLMPRKPLHFGEESVGIARPDRFYAVRIFVGAKPVPDKRIDRTVCRHPA